MNSQPTDESTRNSTAILKDMNTATDTKGVEAQIREFIAKNLLYSTEGFAYADDASLLREGVIDSLGVVELVEFVQNRFGVKVDQQEVIPDNFDSVARLAAYVRSKQSGDSQRSV
jgi:acyl carrier protein